MNKTMHTPGKGSHNTESYLLVMKPYNPQRTVCILQIRQGKDRKKAWNNVSPNLQVWSNVVEVTLKVVKEFSVQRYILFTLCTTLAEVTDLKETCYKQYNSGV